MNVRNTSLVSAALLVALTTVGCTTTPRRNVALDDARQLHQRAQSNPDVGRLAAEEMARADAAMAEAERAWKARGSVSDVEHLAYMAGQRVRIAEATSASLAAQEVVDGAAAERDRLRLALRTNEADSARRMADSERLQAQGARRQAEDERQMAEMARRDVDAARREVEALEAELANLNARQTERGLVVTLGDVLFDSGRAQLRPEGEPNLRKIAEVLRTRPGYRAEIEGHTDSVGSGNSNLQLSERRAEAVMQALMSYGVPAGQLLSRARGQEFPIATNETAAGRQMNRRVEVIFSALDAEGGAR